jgi:CHASE2 domain-containing sensor protein
VLARIIFPLSHRERLRDPARRLNTDTLLAAASPAPAWQGKVIVVGAEHPLDLLQTRLDVAGPERYGFEFQAGAVNALMTGAIVTPLGFVQQWLLVLVMVAAAIAYRIWRVGKSRWLDVIVLPAACFAFLAITVLLYARLGLLVDSLYHLVAFGVTWWMLLALEKRWSHGRS